MRVILHYITGCTVRFIKISLYFLLDPPSSDKSIIKKSSSQSVTAVSNNWYCMYSQKYVLNNTCKIILLMPLISNYFWLESIFFYRSTVESVFREIYEGSKSYRTAPVWQTCHRLRFCHSLVFIIYCII